MSSETCHFIYFVNTLRQTRQIYFVQITHRFPVCSDLGGLQFLQFIEFDLDSDTKTAT